MIPTWATWSSRHRTIRVFLAFLAFLAVTGAAVLPEPAICSPLYKKWNGITLEINSPVPKVACLHRETKISYRVITQGAIPPRSTQAPTIDPSKGEITEHKYYPARGVGSFTYRATKNGVVAIFVTMEWNNRSDTKEVRFEVKPCEYSISIHAISQEKNDVARLYTAFTGSGRFAVDETNHVNGDGNANLYLNIWGGGAPVSCSLNPVVDKNTAFKVKDSEISPLIPGYDYVMIDLDFDPVNIESTSLKCLAMDNNIKIAPITLGGGSFNPNDFGLRALFFPSQGGEQTFKFGKTTGYVSVRPKVIE
jgi:hypothetical protein